MRRLFLLAFVFLAACTTLPEGPLSERNYQSVITVGGRLSVRYQQGGQPQSLQGKFRWQQQGEQTNITLYSPLGQTIATIQITPGLASITQSDGEKKTSAQCHCTDARLTWLADARGWAALLAARLCTKREWQTGRGLAGKST